MSRFHWVLLAGLYISQFLPVAFFFMGLPAILRAEGMELSQIGALYSLGIVWVLKFLWAPLVDRTGFGRWGHYRIWVLATQSGMVAMLVLISRLGGADDFSSLLVLSLVMTAFAATQDIATDAIACRLLPERLRGPGNAIQIAGGLFGLVLGGGGMLLLFPYLGWQGSVLGLAGLVVIAMMPVLFFREKPVQAASIQWVGVGRLLNFWRRPQMLHWALVLVLLNIGVSIIFPLLHTRLVDVGWPVGSIGLTLNILAPTVSLAAVAMTGTLLTRTDGWRLFQILLPLEAFSVLLLVPLATGAAESPLTLPGILLLFCTHNAVATVAVTMMMGRVETGAEGSDFSLQHGVYLLTGFVAGGVSLQLAGGLGYLNALYIALAAMSVALLVCLRLRAPMLKTSRAYSSQ
ncbi:MAG: MFS transporter [Pseudomonadota bacterium]